MGFHHDQWKSARDLSAMLIRLAILIGFPIVALYMPGRMG
jgi:hypothetical protein